MTGLPHQNELVSGLEGAIARLGISQADGVVVSEEQVELEEEEGPAAAVNGKAEQSDDAFVPDDEVAQAAPAAVAVEAEVSDDGDAVVKMDEGEATPSPIKLGDDVPSFVSGSPQDEPESAAGDQAPIPTPETASTGPGDAAADDQPPPSMAHMTTSMSIFTQGYTVLYASCELPASRCLVKPENADGNAGRAYYVCLNEECPAVQSSRRYEGHAWVSWEDCLGFQAGNPLCGCGFPSREDTMGMGSGRAGQGFWTCAVGRCRYYSEDVEGLTWKQLGGEGRDAVPFWHVRVRLVKEYQGTGPTR